jgi:hypothetical protein
MWKDLILLEMEIVQSDYLSILMLIPKSTLIPPQFKEFSCQFDDYPPHTTTPSDDSSQFDDYPLDDSSQFDDYPLNSMIILSMIILSIR